MKSHILLIEDEQDLGQLVSQYLEAFNFSVTWCTDAKSALGQLIMGHADTFDMLVIDVSMPDFSGFELTEKITALGVNVPFLFLTARNEKQDRIHGLKLGADDYIAKPFDIDELVLRIQNIIRRNKNQKENISTNGQQLIKGDIHFNRETLTLSVASQTPVELTSREARLIEYLFRNENRIVKREELLAHVWGEYEVFGGRSVDVFISRLRKYFSASSRVSIENIYGVGFILKVK